MSNNTENSTIQTPVFVGLDVMKFICALLVVYLHTYNHDWGAVGEWVHANLSPIGVPFFFIVSGFLYMKKLQESGEGKKEYFNQFEDEKEDIRSFRFLHAKCYSYERNVLSV